MLIAARILQGVGAALLTPGSLAMIQGAFAREDRARAIGAWVGLGGIASALGPFIGGALVEYADWRWIFLINLPIAVATVAIAQKAVPETLDPNAPRRLDFVGAVLAATALGGLTYALIEWGGPLAPWAILVAVLASGAYVVSERRSTHPMLPLGIFADRTFSAANADDPAGLRRARGSAVLPRAPAADGQRLRRPAGRDRDAAAHDLHALPRLEGRRARQPDRPAHPADGRARW